MGKLISRRGWEGKENNTGCTSKKRKGRRQPSTTWRRHRRHLHARQQCCLFAGLTCPVPMEPCGWGLVLRGFAWTGSGILTPHLPRCVCITAWHVSKRLASWNAKHGTKRGKGLKVHMYWAKKSSRMPCDVIPTCSTAPLAPSWCSVALSVRRAQQNMHEGKHEKEGASNQLNVEYIQHQHPPKMPTLYTHSSQFRVDRRQRGASK